ncbi:MAG: carbohydrate porin [Verrucomicrobia bacterium]|nr:MAG: carbohydrate porin [Verrucomicrobiota bacterium]
MIIATAAASSGARYAYGQELPPSTSSVSSGSESASVTPDGETFIERSTLTGNWWGARDVLSDHGVELNLNLSQFYQGVADGGKERKFEYGGKLDYFLRLDGDKLGLWPGLSLITHAETRYGQDVNTIDGMFSFGNFNMAFPKVGQDVTGLTAFKVTQLLFDHFLLIAGKINTLDDFRLNFTGKNGLERFMNSAMVANIINARTIPYSTYGAGFAVFGQNWPEFTFLARDTHDHAASTDLDKVFNDGAVLTGSIRVPVAPLGLPGTQVLGGNWSSRHYTSLDPSSWVDIPGQGLVAAKESGSWAVYYNFDQYLWINSSNTNTWLGFFAMSGLSDGNPNPVGWNLTVGLGAGGLVPGRERDTLGLGYFHVGISSDFKDLLAGPPAPPGLAQRDEQGIEFYYNAALTRWCHLGADLQVVSPSTKTFNTTVLVGGRLKIDF